MAAVATGRGFARRLTLAAVAGAGLALTSSGARAIEALDGRVQFHGFTEVQLRALDEKFAEELDLAQWYNVLNLELEFDIAPDGIGPIDMLSAYVRGEARYDAIYNDGFYLFPSIDTYGDDARNLPKRLRDSQDKEMAGVLKATDRFGNWKARRIVDRDPATLVPPVINVPPANLTMPSTTDPATRFPNGVNVAAGGPPVIPQEGRESDKGERRGFPGFDTFFRQAGPDDLLGTADDPARYVHTHVADFAFTFKEIRGPIGNDTMIMGPWLPKNFIRANALNTDRANPFRGRVAPTPPLRQGFFPPDQFGVAQIEAIRFHEGDLFDPTFNRNALAASIPTPAPGELSYASIDLLDPVMTRVLLAPETGPDRVLLDLGFWTAPNPSPPPAFAPVIATLAQTFPGRFVAAALSPTGFTTSPNLMDDFGGDFMGGTVPCGDPTAAAAVPIRTGKAPATRTEQCIEISSTLGGFGPNSPTSIQSGGTPGNPPAVDANNDGIPDFPDPGEPKGSYTPAGLVKMTGGKGETPFRPAPDLPNLGQFRIAKQADGTLITDPDLDPNVGQVEGLNEDLLQAQGLYIPSKGTLRELRTDHLDSLQFNYDETDRAWNRGQSQENNKELKEAYFDVEVLDSRLWMRLGLQNIVWGKTELFRTTDQFNPQDLALASLPSLEESRIALWSARFVYSLYDVGVLEDVRAEFAFNFDQYTPSDLGACGEPFTPDVVCTLTAGIFAHSLLGVGVVGIDRPESPWKDLSDLEFGGRIEWRWDRFSFALADFWGFSDFPNPEATFYYERGVDTSTGRPLAARLPNQKPGRCGLAAGERVVDNMNTTTGSPLNPTGTPLGLAYNSSFASHPFSVTTGAPELGAGFVFINRRGGVGTDPDCLRPGGPPGGRNAFAFDQALLADTNALENHHANQQIFAWICAGTVGIAASLDAGSCAWTIFSSDEVLRDILPISFIESLTAVLAGEQNGSAGPVQFLGLVASGTKATTSASQLPPLPLASLNMLYNNPNNPFDRNLDGDRTDRTDCDDPTDLSNCDLGGFDGFDGRVQIPGRIPVGISTTVQNFVTLDRTLTNEQRALLGCGPFYASRCDSSLPFRNSARTTYFGNYGGLDFMNMEASALVQAWPGIEGTQEGQTTTACYRQGDDPTGPCTVLQPGTVGWVPTMDENGRFNNGIGGPICTRFVVEEDREVKLPGCRGVRTLRVETNGSGNPEVLISFEQGYLPSIDGCVIGTLINRPGQSAVNVVFDPSQPAPSAQLQAELSLCNGAITKKAVPNRLIARDPNGDPILTNGIPDTVPNPLCTGSQVGPPFPAGMQLCNAQTLTLQDLPLLHPTAGCVASDVHFSVFGPDDCRYWAHRNLVTEFFDGTAQLFQNELAAFSWNFLMFLTLSSCNLTSFDLDGNDHRLQTGPRSMAGDPQCFEPTLAYQAGRCSISSPQYCTNVKGFLTAAGVTRNTALAGGNSRYGRRTFIWHSGGELTLQYQQRNVLGLSSDFAEDVTKTNWGVEFTWVEDVPFVNNDSAVGLSHTDAMNLTVSVDRPTFINFLNPNRTFFFNSQWFFNYLTDYENGYTFNGPWNVLFTFAVFTGYFQDRVQPQFVTVYDFRSQSGGLLPSFQYRFTESFSVTIGMLYFFGRTELVDMPVREFAPAANRAGPNAYETGVDNMLSLIRQRDEVFMRLRWTF